MRDLEQQLELGRKTYNIATIYALVAELKKQHDTIIAAKDKRIAKLDKWVESAMPVLEAARDEAPGMEREIKSLLDAYLEL